MRGVSVALKSYLAGSLIAIANCVRIDRLDGETYGFTSLDQDITFEGITYSANSSVDASEFRSEQGTGVDNLDIQSLITSDVITDDDLMAGLWDGAKVELFFLPFENTSLGKITLITGTLGEIRLRQGMYQAEVRSESQRLSQQFIEVTSPLCRVRQLFDRRCMPQGFNEGTDTGTLTPASFRFTRAVSQVESSRVLRFAYDTQANNVYQYGRVRFLTGANAGLEREIKAHTISAVTPTNPTSLSNLQLNLMGGDIQGANGAGSTGWNDTSGNARHATSPTAGQRPIVRDGASPAGVRMVEFVDTDDTMTGTLPGAPGIDISAGLSLYVYGEEQALTTGGFNYQALFACGNNVSLFELATRTSTAMGIGGMPAQEYGVNSGNARAYHGPTQLGFQTLTLIFEPPAGATANWYLYRNGALLGSAGVNWQATSIRDTYTVGNGLSANIAFDGLVGAVSVFNAAHTDAARLGVEAYIGTQMAGSGVSEAVVTLQEPFPFAVEAGDTAILEVGCDRTFSRCQTVFSNHLNFQGEPLLPGNTSLLQIGRG